MVNRKMKEEKEGKGMEKGKGENKCQGLVQAIGTILFAGVIIVAAEHLYCTKMEIQNHVQKRTDDTIRISK